MLLAAPRLPASFAGPGTTACFVFKPMYVQDPRTVRGGFMARAFWRGMLIGVGCALSAFQVEAIPITYTLTSTATGTLGGSPFTNAPIAVALRGDTAGVGPGPVGPDNLNNALINTGPATVSIAGLGTATFTHAIDILASFDHLFNFGTVINASGVVIAQV